MSMCEIHLLDMCRCYGASWVMWPAVFGCFLVSQLSDTLAQVTQPGLISPWLASQQQLLTDQPFWSTASRWLSLRLCSWNEWSSSLVTHNRCLVGFELYWMSVLQSLCSPPLWGLSVSFSLCPGFSPPVPDPLHISFHMLLQYALPRALEDQMFRHRRGDDHIWPEIFLWCVKCGNFSFLPRPTWCKHLDKTWRDRGCETGV